MIKKPFFHKDTKWPVSIEIWICHRPSTLLAMKYGLDFHIQRCPLGTFFVRVTFKCSSIIHPKIIFIKKVNFYHK